MPISHTVPLTFGMKQSGHRGVGCMGLLRCFIRGEDKMMPQMATAANPRRLPGFERRPDREPR